MYPFYFIDRDKHGWFSVVRADGPKESQEVPVLQFMRDHFAADQIALYRNLEGKGGYR